MGGTDEVEDQNLVVAHGKERKWPGVPFPTRGSGTDCPGNRVRYIPILLVLTLPLTLVTLGLFLFIFILNALCLWLTSALVKGFVLSSFWAALFGALLISVVSWLLTAFLSDRGQIAVITRRTPPGSGWE